MRRAVFALLLSIVGSAASGQTPASQPPQIALDTSWHVWATLALGPGSTNGDGRIAGDIALWFTRDRLALWVRDAAAGRVFDPGDFSDISLLAGIHPRSERHVDYIVGAGLGISRGHDTSGGNLASQPALAAGAQVNWNYRVVGIGLDAFATVSSGRRYYGAGVAVGIGAFR